MAEPIRREYAVAVIGLGGIGSGAAYWLSRRLGGDVLGLEQFELGHVRRARARTTPGSSACRTTGPTTSASRSGPTRPGQALEAEAGVQVVTTTGGLDLWPAGARIPMADYADSLAAEDVPFETLDAAETIRRWPQWRLADDTVAIFQAAGGLADPNRANAAHQRLAREHGATLLERTPVTGLRDVGGDDRDPDRRRGHVHGGRGRPGGRRLDQRAARLVRPAAAPDRHPRAGHLLRLPASGGLRARPLPGLDLDGRAVLLRLPDLRRGRARKPPRTSAAGRRPPASEASSRTGWPERASTRSWPRHLPGSVGPEIYTKTCLYTLTPGPRLRDRSAARPSRGLRRPRRGPCLQVQLGHRADPVRAGRRRCDALGGRDGAIPDRPAASCSRPIRRRASWSERVPSGETGMRHVVDPCARCVPLCNPAGTMRPEPAEQMGPRGGGLT